MQPALHPLLSDEVEPVPDAEVAAVLADAIRDGRGGQMTRHVATFLAGVSAEFLLDRLALAGVAFVRRIRAPPWLDVISSDVERRLTFGPVGPFDRDADRCRFRFDPLDCHLLGREAVASRLASRGLGAYDGGHNPAAAISLNPRQKPTVIRHCRNFLWVDDLLSHPQISVHLPRHRRAAALTDHRRP